MSSQGAAKLQPPPSAQAAPAKPAGTPGAPQQLRPGAPGQRPAAAMAPQLRKLKKGETLFAEGENSRAMYLIKSGMIRLFKKKGDSEIELDTVRSGQVLGELAFLDGNPRSASGEALTECELMEISGQAFQEVLTRMPDWLKILLKTVVGRLRTASTRIRQLETASTSFDYSDKDGKRSQHYVYLAPTDVLKIASAILLVASRNGKDTGNGPEVRVGLLQRYGNQIMGMPVAKITTVMDIFAQCGFMSVGDGSEDSQVVLKDPNFLEALITYLNEENLLEPSKRHDISAKTFLIMSLVVKHLGKYKPDPKTGLTTINLGEIKQIEAQAAGGKEPFRNEELPELSKIGYIGNINLKSQNEIFTPIKAESFTQAYRFQRVVMSIRAINEQKRKGGKT